MVKKIFGLLLLPIFLLSLFLFPVKAQSKWTATRYACNNVTISGYAPYGTNIHVSIIDNYTGKWLVSQDIPYSISFSPSLTLQWNGNNGGIFLYVYQYSTSDAVPDSWFINGLSLTCPSSPL